MLDISTLTIPLTTLLRENNVLSASEGCTVERGTRVNLDPGRCPWIGVYPGSVDTVPRVAAGSGWKDDVTLQVVIQTASFEEEGQGASDDLERIIAAAMDVVVANLTLGVTGVRMLGSSREYRYVTVDEDGNPSVFMPHAVVKLKFEVRST